MNTEQCARKVYDRMRSRGDKYRKCSHKAQEGKPYCKIHDPEYVAGKDLQRAEKQAANWQADTDRWRLEQVAPELLDALARIVDFCDDKNGAEQPENLAVGLALLLPDARAAIKLAEEGKEHD